MPRPTVRSLLLPIALLLLALPAVAGAQTPVVSIDGSPLQIFTDPQGSMQVRVAGRDIGEFFPSSSTSSVSAGVDLLIDPGTSNQTNYGPFSGIGLPTPDSGPTLTPGAPSRIDTTWTTTVGGTPALRVSQAVIYNNGQNQFDTAYTITNVDPQGAAHSYRAFAAGDLTIRGSDAGVGVFAAGPPRVVGGLNQDVGGTGVFVEETPWTHFQSGNLSDVRNGVSGFGDPGGLNDTVSPEFTDNAAAVQWDGSLAPGQSATYSVGWRFVDTFGITPATATQQTGNDQVLTARVGDANGADIGAGKKVIWSVTGANNTTPTTTTTDKDGKTTFSYVGGNPGEDIVTGFADLNGNGNHDANEPQGTATITWEGPPPPVQGQTVNVRPVKGTVRVKLPKGSTSAGRIAAKRLGVPVHVAASSFVKLKENTPIPLGSTIDTTKGTVRMLSAGAPTSSTGGSPFMGGNFNGGVFRTRQIGTKGLTEMSMVGALRCKNARVPKGGAPKIAFEARRRRSRSLFGNAHGRFRTRGRNSSATVRGTQWFQKDTCKGTLTTVKRGSVSVRDFGKHKTVVVKKGHKYLARALKRKRH